jgi:hypothetical protein
MSEGGESVFCRSVVGVLCKANGRKMTFLRVTVVGQPAQAISRLACDSSANFF